MNPDVQLDSKALAVFCRKWKIEELSLFGSALGDEFRPDSDLDFLVSLQEDATWDLWDWVAMRDELATMTGRKVDLVAKRALRNPYRREHILNNRMILYAA